MKITKKNIGQGFSGVYKGTLRTGTIENVKPMGERTLIIVRTGNELENGKPEFKSFYQDAVTELELKKL